MSSEPKCSKTVCLILIAILWIIGIIGSVVYR